MNYDKLISVIPTGKDNAIHQEELAEIMGVKPAAAKHMVMMARREGIEIISGREGYWFTDNDKERMEFLNTMRRQAYSRLISSKPTKIVLNETKGQISLTEDNISYSKGGKP